MTDPIKVSKVSSRIAESFFMTQVAIEALLRDKIGLDAIAIGSSTIARAVYQRMAACGLTDITKYLIRLQTSTQELDELIEAVIVPETWFFRDRQPFVLLKRYVFSEWLPTHAKGVLRVLSVPCSTGEEPYSVAIALIEAGLSPKQFCIDAVDISKKSLHKAQQGLYSRNSFRGKNPALPDLTQTLKGTDSLSAYALRERYFSRQGEQYQLHDRVRSTVNFIHGNLIDPYFLVDKSAYDVIFCRNVLIYFAPSARERTVRVLDRLLKNNGLLFVGHSETGQILTPPFVPVRHPLAFAHRKKENKSQELGNKKHSTIKSQHSEIKAVTSQKSEVKSRKSLEWQSSHLSTFQHSNLQPSTFNLQPSTFNLQPSTFNLQPSTFNLQPSTFNLQPSTFNPQSPVLKRLEV
jgi:chemotaxis protein methyltransferase WspC